MQPRSEHGRSAHPEELGVMLPARFGTRSERVREIRQRIADDAYRSADVAEEIARRIILSREL